MARLGGHSIGMVGAVDLGAETSAQESLEEAGYLGSAGWRVYAEARKRGAYLRPLGDTVYLCPPLTIADKDLDELLELSDRLVVMFHGQFVYETRTSEADLTEVGRHMAGH